TGGTADRNRSHWSTSKTPSYTKSVSWQHHRRQVLDEIQTPSAINSELYTKMIYLTRNWSLYPNGDGCVTISSPEIKNKYPAAICLALGFFLSIVISVMFCLVKKMVDEYQQNSGQ
ncbi:hypothetical protein OCU91_19355, partial [Escherichia coli]|nr:hypothetical protein [Escherichia coli]